MTSVAISIDLSVPDALPADPAVVMAPGMVYASGESLFVATVNHAGWLVGDVAVGAPDVAGTGGVDGGGDAVVGGTATQAPLVAEPERQATQIHRFAIADAAGPAHYAGSGRVFGVPLNSFALDEYEGHLRVGTTEDRPTGTTNHLWVLGRSRETGLEVTGAVTDLAETERIQAMRFLGSRGFMVTFRQVDPLFCFDLSDPTAPRQLGELKVPGFSTYLHRSTTTTSSASARRPRRRGASPACSSASSMCRT
ncbi:MAG: beta-propeller domain-containing protein [bacterium]